MTTTDAVGDRPCARCEKPAKLQCPHCRDMLLPKSISVFCSQTCFKEAWGEHKKVHAPEHGAWMHVTKRGKGRTNQAPQFSWTGPLRPDRVGPRREVPAHIQLTDYAEHPDGYPTSEIESRQQRSVPTRTPEALKGIREACQLGRRVLDLAHAAVKPGVTTDEIDRIVHEATIEANAYPSPLNYFNFPKSVCTSVNEVICHGIPDRRELQNGDLVNVDISVYLNGYHGDLNETFLVGEVDAESKKLVKVTYECMMKAIKMCKPGVRYRDVGEVISRHASNNGFSVVKSYCGHGIGELFHCAPNIPHYGRNKAVGMMKEGQTFTIEPMINAGSWRDVMWPDGWTAVTEDGKRSAQFEHTLVITADGTDILTGRSPASPPLWWEAEGGALDI